jgi:hypothetical protein
MVGGDYLFWHQRDRKNGMPVFAHGWNPMSEFGHGVLTSMAASQSSILGINENIFEKSCNAFEPDCVCLYGPVS